MAKELAKQYDPKGTEDRVYQNWCDKGYFHTKIDRSKLLRTWGFIVYWHRVIQVVRVI